MHRNLRLTAGLLALAMVVIAGCSGTKTNDAGGGNKPADTAKKGPNGEVYGGTFRIALGEEPPDIDPQVDTTLQVYSMSRDIFNTLIRYKGATLEMEPELLAEMPKVEPDNKTFHFKLREDVKFSDGQQLTAKDVKFTFERMLKPETKAQNTFIFSEIQGAQEMLDKKATELAGFKLTGDYSFDITLSKPFGPFVSLLATPMASIFPADYTAKAGEKFGRQPVGSGPFKLAEWKPNESLVFERNPNYFEKQYPYLDKIEYKVIKEEATRWLEFSKGTFDNSSLPDAERQTALTSGKFTVLESIPLNTYYLSLNVEMFKDKRVREAVSLAIDRAKILKAVINDQGTVAKQFVTPGIPGALTSAPGFAYDPAKAKALLKEAGAEGIKIEAWQSGGDKATDTNLAIQQMLKDVGIDYQIKVVDKATFRPARGNGEVPANQGNWWADYPDPDNYLWTYFHSGDSKSMSVNYSNPAVDQVLEEARGISDQAKRQKMYQDLETSLLSEYAVIPLFHEKQYDLTQKNVHGLISHPSGVSGSKTVWKDSN